LAERIRALDYDISLNGEAMMLDQPIDTTGMVASLLGMHEESARTIREVFPSVDESGDLATAMLFEELGRYHEKIAWMLRAWLGGQSEEVPSPSEGPIS
jgi:DNA-binding ferritin-like protein